MKGLPIRLITKKITTVCGLAMFLVCAAPWFALGFKVDGQTLLELEFASPTDPADKAYLGVGPHEEMTLEDIDADVIVVEVFNMYCHVCQREAENVNRLQNKIENDPHWKDRVKFVGIGAKNTEYEAQVFRKKYRVRFPLLADPGYTIGRTSQSRYRTPTFIVLKKHGKQGFRVDGTHVGPINSLDQLVRSIHSPSGL